MSETGLRLEANTTCQHLERQLIVVTCSNCTPQYKEICVTCGQRLPPIAHHKLTDEQKATAIPAEDLTAGPDEPVTRQQKLSAIQRMYRRRLEDDPDYQAYLLSPEWQRLRRRVLERDSGTCQGCGRCRAVEVHHLSYDHIYHEFLFELVALCRGCHERWHAVGAYAGRKSA